mgnify:CR=1 FL=1
MGMGDCMVEWVGATWDEESDIGKTQRGRRVRVGSFFGGNVRHGACRAEAMSLQPRKRLSAFSLAAKPTGLLLFARRVLASARSARYLANAPSALQLRTTLRVDSILPSPCLRPDGLSRAYKQSTGLFA